MADIQINELLESTTAANSDWIAIDNGSATKKISVQNFNATGAASAAQSAAAAAQSAVSALAAQTAAEQAEDDTQALITSAQTIVSDAQTYANEAATSAGTASTAANTATAQAAIATQAATQAGTYAQNVDSFAKTAKSWAVGGTGTRQGEDTDNSKYYSQQAHNSEINAAASEQAAAISEINAATSESNAATSESNAATSESNAATSEGNASASALLASTSESNAAASEAAAALSKTAAEQAETAAETSKEDSEAWAWGKVDGVDVPPSHPAYHNNAKYYADQASGGVSGVSSFNARSGNVIPQIGDYAADIVEFDNSSNGFTATDTQAAIEEVQDNLDTLDTTVTSALADKMDKVNPTGSGAVSIGRRAGTNVGLNSITMGNNLLATGDYAIALGIGTEARGYYSFAGGYLSKTDNSGTFAYGLGVRAQQRGQVAVGLYNDNKNNTAFEVGNGTGDSAKSNIFEVYNDGTISTDNGTTKHNLNDFGDMFEADYDSDSAVKTAGGIKAWVQSLGYITGLAWAALTGKPFSTVGSGLTVSNDALTADVKTVAVNYTGTASATGVRHQRIGINGVYTAIEGTKYMEQAKTVSTTADTTYTFTNSNIAADSKVFPWASVWGIVPSSVTVASGTCSVVIPKQSSAFSLTVGIYIR